MSIDKAIKCGLIGNEISKGITGTTEVCPERTAVAITAGGTVGLVASEVVSVGLCTLGVVSAPVAIPLVVASAAIAGIASLFDW